MRTQATPEDRARRKAERLAEGLQAAATNADARVRVEVVGALFGISRATVYYWAKTRPAFPRPVNGRWRAGDLRAYAQTLGN